MNVSTFCKTHKKMITIVSLFLLSFLSWLLYFYKEIKAGVSFYYFKDFHYFYMCLPLLFMVGVILKNKYGILFFSYIIAIIPVFLRLNYLGILVNGIADFIRRNFNIAVWITLPMVFYVLLAIIFYPFKGTKNIKDKTKLSLATISFWLILAIIAYEYYNNIIRLFDLFNIYSVMECFWSLVYVGLLLIVIEYKKEIKEKLKTSDIEISLDEEPEETHDIRYYFEKYKAGEITRAEYESKKKSLLE